MTREEAFLRRVRRWVGEGRIPEPRRWLERHHLAPLFPDLYGVEPARRAERTALAQNLLLLHKARAVLESLAKAGIAAVPLKGVDLLDRLYRDREGVRRTTDIDILVDRRRLGLAHEVVEGLGYRPVGEEPKEVQLRWSKDVTYRDPEGIVLELHHEMFLDMGFTLTWEELRSAGQLEPGRGVSGSDRLALEGLTIYLLVHLAAHRFGADSLRWVLDLMVLLDRHAQDLDGDRLTAVAQRLRGRRAAGGSAAALARLVPEADLGPLAGLSTGSLRERLALRLVDPERAVLLGGAGWSQAGSVMSRLLLEPSLASSLSFLYRKHWIRRGRRRVRPR